MKNKDVFYVLETDRLKLRKLRLDDIDDMFIYGHDELVSEYVMWPQHQTLDDSRNFVEVILKYYEDGNFNFWVLEEKSTQKMIGTINFVDVKEKYNWAELGFVLNRQYWNQGYMTEAIKAVLKHGFETLGLNKIQARCIKENIGSYRAMEKVGMIYEGLNRQHMIKNGKYVDLVNYSILKSEFK